MGGLSLSVRHKKGERRAWGRRWPFLEQVLPDGAGLVSDLGTPRNAKCTLWKVETPGNQQGTGLVK